MRLDFNVLWVDDQPDRVAAQRKRIAKEMANEGFEFKPSLCKSVDEARESVHANIFADQIDLILIDWDLGGNQQGQDAIAAIREVIPYKDVVFYSGQPADALRKLAFEAGVEGIYCANREGLVQDVLGVFESLVRKILDLDHTRGIVMGATSDIDFMVNECLVAIDAQSDDDSRRALLVQAMEYIDAKIRELTELAERMRMARKLPELFEAHLVFTAYDRLGVLARALNSQAFQAHKDYRKSVTSYQQNVVPKRNALGHLARELRDGIYVLVDSKGKVYTLETTRELRKLILELRADFRSLRDDLIGDAVGVVASAPARGE